MKSLSIQTADAKTIIRKAILSNSEDISVSAFILAMSDVSNDLKEMALQSSSAVNLLREYNVTVYGDVVKKN